VVQEAVATCGAILGGRRGYDEAATRAPGEASRLPYGGGWQGPIFVLTHHPEDAIPDPGVNFLNCDLAKAVETGLAAAGDKNLEIFGADIARQCIDRGLIDEFCRPPGTGDARRRRPAVRLPWHRAGALGRIRDADPAQVADVVDLRYRPAR
jgi:hypothetical protein